MQPETILLVIGYWLLVIGYWLLVIGYWLLVIGYWLLVIGYWLLVIGCLLFVIGGSWPSTLPLGCGRRVGRVEGSKGQQSTKLHQMDSWLLQGLG
ncbi:MAG: hypothetical protein ACBR50_06280 [Microcoleus sp.]